MGQNEQNVDFSRRDLGAILGLIGGTAGLAALAACSENAGASPSSAERIGSAAEALKGTSFIWVDTINGPGADGGVGAPTLRGVVGADTSSSCSPVAVVGGYATTGDGGGGAFFWDKASSSGDDGGSIIVPTGSTTGRWRRIYSGPLDIRWFGASTAATDNTAAITSALMAAAQGTGSSVVYIPAGTYTVNQPVNQDHIAISGATGLVIRGDGYGKSIITNTSPVNRMGSRTMLGGQPVLGFFSFLNCTDCGVEDIQIVGNCPAPLNGVGSNNDIYQGLYFWNCADCYVRRCLFTNFIDDAINLQGECPNVAIEHNIVRNNNLCGINPQLNAPDTSIIISHNFLDVCFGTPLCGNGGACVVQGNTITQGLVPSPMGPGSVNLLLWVNPSRALITDNVLFDSITSTGSAPAISLNGSAPTLGDIIISNNVITGIQADWTDVVGSAINVDGSVGNGGGTYSGVGTVIIANNLIDNCGRNDSTQARGIVVDGPYVGSVTIYGNTIRNRLPNNVRIGIRVLNTLGTVPAGAVTIGRNYFDFDPMDTVQVLPYVLDSPAKLDGRVSEFKRIVSTLSPTTLAISDEDVFVTANGALTLTLPDATLSYGGGKRIAIKNTSTQLGTTTVTAASSQKIDGAASQTMATPGASLTLQSDGSNWQVMAKV